MRKVTTRRPQLAGMALGGLGTGTVELFPDGRLESWQIFNLGKWASRAPEKDGKKDLPDFDREPLSFYLRAEGEDFPVVVRKLSYASQIGGFRSAMYSWMKEIEEISWQPDFPAAKMVYRDSALPLKIEGEFLSPFLPLDAKTSGTPGFYLTFRIQNESDRPLNVSLMGLLKNPVNRGEGDRRLHNRIDQDGSFTCLTMESDSDIPLPQNGSLTLALSGGAHSFLRSEFEGYLGAYVLGGPLGATEESCLFGFRETGALPNLGWERFPEQWKALTPEKAETLSDEEIDALICLARETAGGEGPWKRLSEISPCPTATVEGRRKFVQVMARLYQSLQNPESDSFCLWGGGGLCGSITLQPGEAQELRFLVGWHFPNHVSPNGNFVGHRYSEWFADAKAVCEYLHKESGRILPAIRQFGALLSDTTAPDFYPAGWIAHLNTLIKCSWWAKDGSFGIWEGYGSCGFHTTDITYHGSWGLAALFPQLQMGQMEMGARFQREDGRVHHFFTPDFQSVDNGFDRVDMNQQFVLLVCRDYLWTGDQGYLERMWPHIVRAMDSTAALDTDGDGLPDQDTGANTYDAWKFQGTPAYISMLWLAALAAAVRIASALGRETEKAGWETLLKKGKESFQSLWNGSYYSLWVDGGLRDECCMSDQLDGQWFCRLLGLADLVEESQAKTALSSILRCNFQPETGLINASYPKGEKATLYTYKNVQAEANWSGVEYAFASLLLSYGLTDEAAQIAQAVEDRYFRLGRIFNHEECGEYYYRPLSSWSMLLSLTGLRWDAPAGRLRIAPALPRLKAPWFIPQGYGTLEVDEDSLRIHCLSGSLPLRELVLEGALPGNAESRTISVDAAPLAAGQTFTLSLAQK